MHKKNSVKLKKGQKTWKYHNAVHTIKDCLKIEKVIVTFYLTILTFFLADFSGSFYISFSQNS